MLLLDPLFPQKAYYCNVLSTFIVVGNYFLKIKLFVRIWKKLQGRKVALHLKMATPLPKIASLLPKVATLLSKKATPLPRMVASLTKPVVQGWSRFTPS